MPCGCINNISCEELSDEAKVKEYLRKGGNPSHRLQDTTTTSAMLENPNVRRCVIKLARCVFDLSCFFLCCNCGTCGCCACCCCGEFRTNNNASEPLISYCVKYNNIVSARMLIDAGAERNPQVNIVLDAEKKIFLGPLSQRIEKILALDQDWLGKLNSSSKTTGTVSDWMTLLDPLINTTEDDSTKCPKFHGTDLELIKIQQDQGLRCNTCHNLQLFGVDIYLCSTCGRWMECLICHTKQVSPQQWHEDMNKDEIASSL